ncbi:MAG: arginine--tRNA ligase [Spirochaetota bacterium]
MLKEEISLIVEYALRCAINDGKLPAGEYPQVKIEYPKDEKFGDYATPVAMESARLIKRNPMETGEILKEYISKSPLVGSVDVARPGFINIFVADGHLASNISAVLDSGCEYGRRKKDTPSRISIEFVSANPTGPLNVVSARAAALGDTLANLMEADGDIVDREFYINDFGNQVNLLGRSVWCRYRELNGETVDFPEDGYHGEYVKDIAAYIRDNYASELAALGQDEDAAVAFLAQKAVDFNVSGQQADMELFRVSYKQWFHESWLHRDNKVMDTLKRLEEKGVIYGEEGKKLFASTRFGDDKDRVVVRDDGRPTYLLADIAYHMNKYERGYDRVIDIWGPDHHGYIARIHGAIEALGYRRDSFRVLISQQVNLLAGGELVKMSKRLGNFSRMRELIDEIGADVARFFFVMRSMESHLDFDLELAKKQSSENPVFYLQYAHARICSVFREAEKQGIVPLVSSAAFAHYNNPEARALMILIAKYPDEVADAAANLEPHRITNYMARLAQAYHKFYFEHRILSEDKEKSAAYLSLCAGVRVTLSNGLSLLGVSAPERM